MGFGKRMCLENGGVVEVWGGGCWVGYGIDIVCGGVYGGVWGGWGGFMVWVGFLGYVAVGCFDVWGIWFLCCVWVWGLGNLLGWVCWGGGADKGVYGGVGGEVGGVEEGGWVGRRWMLGGGWWYVGGGGGVVSGWSVGIYMMGDMGGWRDGELGFWVGWIDVGGKE
uniref:Uncharacterized protein n=1 Tax=Knipowitschia caucasica TaxID=637954 RepID=A0AAV2LS99_KNICA